ncbi:MAG: toll/interleukin-1 receptor domain-containing protein [Bryobacteraceae bacterium]|nr:toll/interleukin-1 receptor domain-containing protein [Bryobacteraceae bacterium]
MGSIFISYRRDDSSGYTGRIYDRLSKEFGDDRVFRDVSDIAPGENFVDAVGRNVAEASVVLIIIGREWLEIRDVEGRRRLDNPQDLVRREAEMALAGKATVIPVLVEGAAMPKEGDLPASVRKLVHCNAIRLSEDTFDFGIEQLAKRINHVSGGGQRPWRLAAAVLVLAACAAAFLFLRPSEDISAIQAALTVAKTGDYNAAWKSLEGLNGRHATTARQDLAMEWVRNARAAEGGNFSSITTRLTPVLAQGAAAAEGQRKADLLAHLGWSTFLQSRDTGVGDPEPFYRQALEADRTNPFANAMLAHWLLWEGRERALDQARKHFEAALPAGRQRPEVRRLQFAALRNLSSDEGKVEYSRALNDARKNGENVDERDWARGDAAYYFGLTSKNLGRMLMEAMPATEHADLLRWLAGKATDESKKRLLECWVGRLEEAAGRTGPAIEAYRRAQAGLDPGSSGPVPDEVRSALRRLVK